VEPAQSRLTLSSPNRDSASQVPKSPSGSLRLAIPDVWYLTNSYKAFKELINLWWFEVCDGFEMPSRDTRINSTQTMQNILACVEF
jgi:hypothetical protein